MSFNVDAVIDETQEGKRLRECYHQLFEITSHIHEVEVAKKFISTHNIVFFLITDYERQVNSNNDLKDFTLSMELKHLHKPLEDIIEYKETLCETLLSLLKEKIKNYDFYEASFELNCIESDLYLKPMWYDYEVKVKVRKQYYYERKYIELEGFGDYIECAIKKFEFIHIDNFNDKKREYLADQIRYMYDTICNHPVLLQKLRESEFVKEVVNFDSQTGHCNFIVFRLFSNVDEQTISSFESTLNRRAAFICQYEANHMNFDYGMTYICIKDKMAERVKRINN